MASPTQRADTVERMFSHIQEERMQDMPLLNPRLRVQAVGFRAWGNGTLGVLVTPWFMNLVLWPETSPMLPTVGDCVTHEFPSGHYTFTAASEPGLGTYEICPLFSPMHEFEDQATAVATAEAALAELLAAPQPPLSRRQRLRNLAGAAS